MCKNRGASIRRSTCIAGAAGAYLCCLSPHPHSVDVEKVHPGIVSAYTFLEGSFLR